MTIEKTALFKNNDNLTFFLRIVALLPSKEVNENEV
jgi:hypothetical protein